MQNPTEWVIQNLQKVVPQSFQSSTNIDIDEVSCSANNSIVLEDLEKSQQIAKKRKLESTQSSAVRILNRNANNSFVIRHPSSSSVQRIVKNSPTVCVTPKKTKIVKVSEENYTIRQISTSPASAPIIIKNEVAQFSLMEEKQKNIESSIQLNPIIVETTPENLKPLIMDSLKEIAEIKEMLSTQQNQNQNASKLKIEDNSNISHSQFNKVQLFNGIKRYLSPSMNALLRIELFSTPLREYKKDEKIICQELLQLGDNTYNFLTEEWRLRLPAKHEVKQWIEENVILEDDDAS